LGWPFAQIGDHSIFTTIAGSSCGLARFLQHLQWAATDMRRAQPVFQLRRVLICHHDQ
jgi:hypothetical protein